MRDYARNLLPTRVPSALLHSASARFTHTVSLLGASHPGDADALSAWLSEHPEARPRCVLGKTEGNGCVNDFTRGYASLVMTQTLAERKGDASIIMSGGTEGVLTPHLLLFASGMPAASVTHGSARLSIGAARTRIFAPHELGRQAQAAATRDAVLEACADAGLQPSDLHFAQIKCPLLTPERVAAAESACATEDAYYSMALSRGASALGVALATGELPPMAPVDDLILTDMAAFSCVASASAGVELMHSEVLVVGNAMSSTSALRTCLGVMQDAIDAPSVFRMLDEAGLEHEHGQLTPASRARVRAVLSKADPAASVRGERTTMFSDSDINATRHARVRRQRVGRSWPCLLPLYLSLSFSLALCSCAESRFAHPCAWSVAGSRRRAACGHLWRYTALCVGRCRAPGARWRRPCVRHLRGLGGMKYECMHDCTSGGAGGPVGRDEAVDDRKKYDAGR